MKAKLPSGLFRKLTTRLRPTLSHPKTPSPAVASPPLPHSPTHRSAVPVLSNDLVAVQRRQAALQQCGLVPLPRKDLSQLERELDRRFSHVVVPPQDQPEQGEPSTAEKIRREWRAKNEARSAEQSGDRDSRGPSDVASDPAEEEKTTRVSTSASSRTASSPAHPPSLRSIPEDFSFIDIPEEDDATPEIEKVHFVLSQLLHCANFRVVKSLPPVPPTEAAYPLRTPLPNSSSSSSAQLPETSPSLSPRENKRLPPIDVNPRTNDTKETTDEATHGNRQSIHSLMTKSSLPALSPTMTASSFSTIPTPIDDESKERMEGMITSSSSGKARSTRLGRASDVGRNSEELNVVHETIPESPEPAATESKSLNPTKESTPTINTAGLEALVEKREKWKMSTGIFQSNRRNSGSSSKRPAGSELNLRWGAIANDFSLKAPDHPKARSSILPVSVITSM